MNELTLTNDKLELIKRTVAAGATNDELELFLYTAKRTGLDPLTRQIYCVKRKGKMVIQTGIDGYRVVADRTGKYAGNDDPVFDNEQRPRRATVTVYKIVDGQRCPFTSTARWDQYYPGEGDVGFMWRKMPHLMLGKCAESLALRKAFPQDLSGIYTAEEMDQADNNFPAQVTDRGSRPPSIAPGTAALEPPAPEPSSTTWRGKILEISKLEGQSAKGPWTLHRINMADGQTCTTFDAGLAADAEIVIGQQVEVRVEPNARKKGTWTYLGFEALETIEVGGTATTDTMGTFHDRTGEEPW